MEHMPVAQLLGSEGQASSTPVCLFAISKNATRIAIAQAHKINIYDIHPDAFFYKSKGSLPVAKIGLPFDRVHVSAQEFLFRYHDYCYQFDCAQGFFHDYVHVEGTGVLEEYRLVGIRPKELPSRGVIYSMAFATANTLWAWTDRGLVKWSFGRNIAVIRVSHSLSPITKLHRSRGR